MAVLHTENLDLQTDGNQVTGYLVRPDSQAPLPGVVLIQEWWGIEPHVRDVAQRLAKEGFVVLVPDLYHGTVVTEPDEAAKHVMTMRGNMDRALKEIRAALDTLKARPDVAPKRLGVMGFCVGGLLTWHTALHSDDLGAVVPWYGAGFDPSLADIAHLQTPVLAIYGGQDPSIPLEQVQQIEQLLKDAGKEAEVVVYPAAGHAFLNPDHGMGHTPSAEAAWPRAVAFLQQHLTPHE